MPGGVFGGIADKLSIERSFEPGLRHSAENFKALVEAESTVAV